MIFSEDDMYRFINLFKKFQRRIELYYGIILKKNTIENTSKTFYDCTNYYFEIEYNDNDEYALNDDGSIK